MTAITIYTADEKYPGAAMPHATGIRVAIGEKDGFNVSLAHPITFDSLAAGLRLLANEVERRMAQQAERRP